MAFELEDFDDLNKMDAIKQFIEQLNCFVDIVDQKNQIVLCNEQHAKLYGFNTAEEITSKRLTARELKCAISEISETLHNENKYIIENKQSKYYISNVNLSDKKLHLLYGSKNPIIDSAGEVIGINMFFSYMMHNPLINLTHAIAQSTKHFTDAKNANQFSFAVVNNLESLNITPRQMETLFYLLRGKSGNEIAAILKRSPRTIEKHIEALKLVFNCSKKSELIEKTLDSGCLNYIPKSFIKNIPKSDCIL